MRDVFVTVSFRELKRWEERVRTLQAEFLNYQDRVRREREREARFQAEALIRDLLLPLDSLEQCLAALPESEVTAGVRMMQKELLRVLGLHGLERIAPEPGEPFDPSRHEAVESVPDAERPARTVVETLKPGFRLHERVLRPAAVRVAVPQAT